MHSLTLITPSYRINAPLKLNPQLILQTWGKSISVSLLYHKQLRTGQMLDFLDQIFPNVIAGN